MSKKLDRSGCGCYNVVMVKAMTDKQAAWVARNAEAMERAGVAAKDHEAFARMFFALAQTGANTEVAELVLFSGLHANTVRRMVNTYGAALGKRFRGTLKYGKSSYSASGSGAFGHASNARGAYSPADVYLVK